MNEQYEKSLTKLELDKVLELLAAETTCADAAVLARELTPVPYLSQVQRLMEETDAAYRLMAQFPEIKVPDYSIETAAEKIYEYGTKEGLFHGRA